MAYDMIYDIGHGTDTWENGGGKGVRKNGKVYEEHTANSDVGERTVKILKAHGLKVYLVQKPMSKEVDLMARIRKANSMGVKLYWSSHFNAGIPSVKGVCAFYWHTAKNSKRLAEEYAKNAKAMGFNTHGNGIHASERGSWTNLAVCRETSMASVLAENGFMTNSEDFEGIFGKYKESYRQGVAELQAKSILEGFFNIKYDESKFKKDNVKPNPEYTTAPEDRIGEVAIGDLPMNYRKEPNFDSPVLRELPAHYGKDGKPHTVHLYEKKDFWLRLGAGWISNKDGKYATVKMYPEKPEQPKEPAKKVYRVIVNGEQVGAYSEDSNILEQARKAMREGKDEVLIQEV
jgi:N-acetylmuramoyl-L-alanine amidase